MTDQPDDDAAVAAAAAIQKIQRGKSTRQATAATRAAALEAAAAAVQAAAPPQPSREGGGSAGGAGCTPAGRRRLALVDFLQRTAGTETGGGAHGAARVAVRGGAAEGRAHVAAALALSPDQAAEQVMEICGCTLAAAKDAIEKAGGSVDVRRLAVELALGGIMKDDTDEEFKMTALVRSDLGMGPGQNRRAGVAGDPRRVPRRVHRQSGRGEIVDGVRRADHRAAGGEPQGALRSTGGGARAASSRIPPPPPAPRRSASSVRAWLRRWTRCADGGTSPCYER